MGWMMTVRNIRKQNGKELIRDVKKPTKVNWVGDSTSNVVCSGFGVKSEQLEIRYAPRVKIVLSQQYSYKAAGWRPSEVYLLSLALR
jgi:hypothetical protein